MIKAETPTGDTTGKLGPRGSPSMASLFLATNRNKRSIVLDLKRPAGREALARNVFLHNFRPNLAARSGLGYERFAPTLPSLIHCATYVFRRDCPAADHPAYDDISQAACRQTDLQRVSSDQSRDVPTILADKTTALHVVSANVAGPFARERSGRGQATEAPQTNRATRRATCRDCGSKNSAKARCSNMRSDARSRRPTTCSSAT